MAAYEKIKPSDHDNVGKSADPKQCKCTALLWEYDNEATKGLAKECIKIGDPIFWTRSGVVVKPYLQQWETEQKIALDWCYSKQNWWFCCILL